MYILQNGRDLCVCVCVEFNAKKFSKIAVHGNEIASEVHGHKVYHGMPRCSVLQTKA